ncbi:MAG: DUF134 domain-containing protein [Tissierellales bacterium]|nr:DUF134 domain-containing protein [Tissierellales bacterium]MBN2828121.1 DUF134 domain-containing protein [Tissierellales bacterium]
MPRPRKQRRVCEMPMIKSFGPINRMGREVDDIVTLTIDEYEVVRLVDLEGLNQEACADRMDVARSTIQRMYEEAKRKVADCIVNGKILRIEGGDYFLCQKECQEGMPCYVGRHRRGQNRIGREGN